MKDLDELLSKMAKRYSEAKNESERKAIEDELVNKLYKTGTLSMFANGIYRKSPQSPSFDYEDIEQELAMGVINFLPEYDPSKGERGSFLGMMKVIQLEVMREVQRENSKMTDHYNRIKKIYDQAVAELEEHGIPRIPENIAECSMGAISIDDVKRIEDQLAKGMGTTLATDSLDFDIETDTSELQREVPDPNSNPLDMLIKLENEREFRKKAKQIKKMLSPFDNAILRIRCSSNASSPLATRTVAQRYNSLHGENSASIPDVEAADARIRNCIRIVTGAKVAEESVYKANSFFEESSATSESLKDSITAAITNGQTFD